MLIFLLLFTIPALAQEFREHTIATGLRGGYQVVPYDMNRDGKPDLIALASGMPELVWYENPRWERHVIAGPFSRMINAAADDIDGDGIPEIALAYEFANVAKNSLGVLSILRFEGGNWVAKEIDRIPTSHRLRWADLFGTGKKVLINAVLTASTAEPPGYEGQTGLYYLRSEGLEAPGDSDRESRRRTRNPRHRLEWRQTRGRFDGEFHGDSCARMVAKMEARGVEQGIARSVAEKRIERYRRRQAEKDTFPGGHRAVAWQHRRSLYRQDTAK